MYLESLNEYYENKSLKVNDHHQRRNEPDVFSLEDEYKRALKLTIENANNEAIKILEKLAQNSLLVSTATNTNVKSTDVNDTKDEENVMHNCVKRSSSSNNSSKKQQSERSSEFALQLKKCVLRNLTILYEKVNRPMDCHSSHLALYHLDHTDILVCYSYGVFLFNSAQLIQSYALFMQCIQLVVTHWKSYEYLLVIFYLMKDVDMCKEIMRKVTEHGATLHMASYVICHLWIEQDGAAYNGRLYYDGAAVRAIQMEFGALFQSTMDSITAKIQQYKHQVKLLHSFTAMDMKLEIVCVDRALTAHKYPSIKWVYPYKSYVCIGQFLLDVHRHLFNSNNSSNNSNNCTLVFSIDLKAIEFNEASFVPMVTTLDAQHIKETTTENDKNPTTTSTEIEITQTNSIQNKNEINEENNNDENSGTASDCDSDDNAEAVKPITRRLTRTKEKPQPIVTISLYEKFYGILRELLVNLSSASNPHHSQLDNISCDNPLPTNIPTSCHGNEINISSSSHDNEIIEEENIAQSASLKYQDDIDEFIATNSTTTIFLDIVYHYLRQFVKFDTSLTLDEWSLEVCHAYMELGGLFYNQRDIVPVYLNGTDELPNEDYVLNAFIMLRVLEIKFILLGSTTTNNNNKQIMMMMIVNSKLDSMLEYIDTVVMFCKVKLLESNRALTNPPVSLLFMVIRQSWLLAHYHMVTNPNNYVAIEKQLTACKVSMETYALDCVRIFPPTPTTTTTTPTSNNNNNGDCFNISLTQINSLIESLSVKKKIDGFKCLLESHNYSKALAILNSLSIGIPERVYVDHKLVNRAVTTPSLPLSSLIDVIPPPPCSSGASTSSSIIHGNTQKQLALLIKCHYGLGQLGQVVKGVLSSISYCLSDYNITAGIDQQQKQQQYNKDEIDKSNETNTNTLKHLFHCWNIEKGLGQLNVCFKKSWHYTTTTSINVESDGDDGIFDCNLYTDALAQLTNLLCALLPCRGDNWIDLMTVHCVKLIWYLTKSLAIASTTVKMKQIVFHMAEELINILMVVVAAVNGQQQLLYCRFAYYCYRCVLSDILLDLNDIYGCNSFKRVYLSPIANTTTTTTNKNQQSKTNSSTSTLETSFSDESYRNTMLLYYSCLIGYPSANKIKHLISYGALGGGVNSIERGSVGAINLMENNHLSIPFSIVMSAFEFFKPMDQVSLGPYLFKVSSTIIGNSRPALSNDLYKCFQLLTNFIVHELELMFDNFKSECKRVVNFIKCRKPHCSTDSASDDVGVGELFNINNNVKIPTHLYNSRFVLQFVIDYHLKMALLQGEKHLSEAKKIIAIYLFMAPSDSFGWWAVFCHNVYYVNFEVLDYYDLQSTINISAYAPADRSPSAVKPIMPIMPIMLDRSRKLGRIANRALNSLQLAIKLSDDDSCKIIMRLDSARASLLFSTYEFCVCIFGAQQPHSSNHLPLIQLHLLTNDHSLRDHLKVFEDECFNNQNFLFSAPAHACCNICEVYNVRHRLQLLAYEKFASLIDVNCHGDNNTPSSIVKFHGDINTPAEITYSNLKWYIYYMSYKTHVLCDNSNLNTPKSAQLLLHTLRAYLQHVNCSIDQLDKFLIHQHLSDTSKCFYQLLSSVFTFMCSHNRAATQPSCGGETKKTITPKPHDHEQCFCVELRLLLDSIMESVIRVDKNQDSVEFVQSLLSVASIAKGASKGAVVVDCSQWALIVDTFKDSPYACRLHGDNICIKMCDHYLMSLMDKTLIYMVVILKRFYSSYDYVRLLVKCVMYGEGEQSPTARRCSLVNQFLQYIITGNVNYFGDVLFCTKIKLDVYVELFGFAKIVKYLKPSYAGFINLSGKGHLFKHAWRTGIEEIESLDDFQHSITSVFSCFVRVLDFLPYHSSKEDTYARLALKIDSNTAKSYLLPFKGVAIIRKIFFYLIDRIVQLKNTLLLTHSTQTQCIDDGSGNGDPTTTTNINVANTNKFLYIALKIYKSNVLFEKTKRNELLVCLDVIHAKLTNRQLPSQKDYPVFFTSQHKKELFELVQKYLTQIKYTFQ